MNENNKTIMPDWQPNWLMSKEIPKQNCPY